MLTQWGLRPRRWRYVFLTCSVLKAAGASRTGGVMASRFDSDCGSFVCGDAAADGGCGGGSFCRFRSTICSEYNALFGAVYSLSGRSRASGRESARALGSDLHSVGHGADQSMADKVGKLRWVYRRQGEFAKPHLRQGKAPVEPFAVWP